MKNKINLLIISLCFFLLGCIEEGSISKTVKYNSNSDWGLDETLVALLMFYALYGVLTRSKFNVSSSNLDTKDKILKSLKRMPQNEALKILNECQREILEN